MGSWRGRATFAWWLSIGALALCHGRPTSAQPLVEYSIPSAGALPAEIAAGSDGSLWFTDPSLNEIGKVTTTGIFAEYDVPTSNANPSHLTAGPDGNVWFTEFHGNKIGKITTVGVFTEYVIPTVNSGPVGITAGPDGNLWFTEFSGNNIGKITTTGIFTEYPIPTAGSEPEGIAGATDGNVWFTESHAGKIGKVTPAGTFTEYVIPTGGSTPIDITAGSDGNLWFTEFAVSQIGKVTTAGSFTEYSIPSLEDEGLSGAIAVGPDGNLWFTQDGDAASKIGKLTTAGALTEYFVPTTNSTPMGITPGPDGNLWFTEYTGGKIGLLSPTALGCNGIPMTSCRNPGKSKFLFKTNLSDASKDKLSWKWIKGASTSQTEFGNPPGTTDYALCLYVGTASAALAGEAVVPANSGTWSASGAAGYKYNNRIPGDINKVGFKGSNQNNSKLLVKGNGALLPALLALTQPVPIVDALTVQFVNSQNGLCWGASYAYGQLRISSTEFKAQTP